MRVGPKNTAPFSRPDVEAVTKLMDEETQKLKAKCQCVWMYLRRRTARGVFGDPESRQYGMPLKLNKYGYEMNEAVNINIYIYIFRI